MKKKILISLGALVVVTVLSLNVSLSGTNNSSNTNLAGLITKNEANAECIDMFGGNNWGKCIFGGTMCVGDPGNNQCSFGW